MTIKIPRLDRFAGSILFLVVGALLMTNATLLAQMQSRVSRDKKAAAEAARPAELALTIVSAPSCTECFDIEKLTASLKNLDKIKITQETNVTHTSDEGVALIAQHNITRVPAVVITGAIDKALGVASFLKNLGTKKDDGVFVTTDLPPPYFDLAQARVKGKFRVTYLTDKSCKECYDPTLHRQVLAGLGMQTKDEQFVDRTEAKGQKLIATYRIESTPTILLTGDLDAYRTFVQVWPSVGTVEKDGTYIFRAGQAMVGTYRDLKTGKIVTRAPPSHEQNKSTP